MTSKIDGKIYAVWCGFKLTGFTPLAIATAEKSQCMAGVRFTCVCVGLGYRGGEGGVD